VDHYAHQALTENVHSEPNDPRTHFIITEMGELSTGIQRAYLTWNSDSRDYYPKVEELDLAQLGMEILSMSNGSLGHGWIVYRGQLKENLSQAPPFKPLTENTYPEQLHVEK